MQHPASPNRPLIIPIFLPHAGCPHQCVFCNQVALTGAGPKPVSADQLRFQIQNFLKYKQDRRQPVQISFFGGNFLGLKTELIEIYLTLAAEYVEQGDVDSIRFSTRPDTISPDRLNLISPYPVETIELGVQSMDDQVLAMTRRGHSAADTIRAVQRLRRHEWEIGLQMMVGLPGDTERKSLISAEKIAALRPNFIRIYPTVVVKNSQLARWYQKGTYTPLSLKQAVTRVKTLYRYFYRHRIKVIRMGLQASSDLENDQTILAGPYHPAFGHLVYSEIFLDAAQKALSSVQTLSDTMTIFVNPRSVSKMRGLNNSNIKMLKKKYHLNTLNILPDDSLTAGELRIGKQESIKLINFC